MREALISSSVLILALTALRAVFRKRISRRLQYALWALVLLRLALPVSLPRARFSVMTRAEQWSGQAAQAVRPDSQSTVQAPTISAANAGHVPTARPRLSTADLLFLAWLAGTGLTLGCFLTANLRFSWQLRRTRAPFDAPGCPLPVYVSEAAVSPCLFGLLRPAVYLTPKAAGETEIPLRHVLTHELCHYRHGDHVWSALRCLLLSVYWFDPLVWLAAVLSRIDGEQACDEAAIRALGETERLSYGKTLLDMVAVRAAPPGLLCAATTMISGKKSLKKRLEQIVRRRKPLVWALVVTLLLTAALVGCTFTSAKKDTEADHYLEYTERADDTLDLPGHNDLYRYHYRVDGSPRLTIWGEYWEDGQLADVQTLSDFDLSDGPGDLDLSFYDSMVDGADMQGLHFLFRSQGQTSDSSFPVPIDASFIGRATSWLGSGSENRYDVTEKQPVILLCLAYHQANSGSLHGYDCEYLMENPDAVREYERAVLVKCAFADESGQNYPLPSVSGMDSETINAESHDVLSIIVADRSDGSLAAAYSHPLLTHAGAARRPPQAAEARAAG